MKKCFKAAIVVIVATISMTANAQRQKDVAIGANIVSGRSNNITNSGIGAKFHYHIFAPLRLDASFTYFLPEKIDYKVSTHSFEMETNMWDLSANLHYLFPIADNVSLYPLAGMSMFNGETKIKAIISNQTITDNDGDGASKSEIGFNIGAGIDLKLTETIIFNAEFKYHTGSEYNRILVLAGIAFRF